MAIRQGIVVSFAIFIALASLLVVPARAALTGSITFDTAQLTATGAATITVDDFDLNFLVPATNIRTGTWGSVGSTVFMSLDDTGGNSSTGFASGAAAGDEISGTPVIATDTAAGKSVTDYSVSVFNRTTGRILIQFGGASAPGVDTVTIAYKLATVNTATVVVTSPSDTTGISVTLAETGIDTGLFRGRIAISSSASLDVAGAVPLNAATTSLDRILVVGAQTVTATYQDVDPAAARTATLVVPSADLSITKAADAASATLNDEVVYTVTATNSGPSTATDVVVTDTLPGSSSFVSAVPTQGSCGESGGVVTCNLGTLNNGDVESITVRVTAPATPQSLTNTVSIVAAEPDPSDTNNSADVTTQVGNTADLVLAKTSEAAVITGLPFTYTITVTNKGPIAATGVTVVDTLPPGVVFVSASSGCSPTGQTVTCSVGTIANGASPVLSIVVNAPMATGEIVNTATVTASEPTDPDTGNNTASATTWVAIALGVPALGTWAMLGLSALLAITVLGARHQRPTRL